LLLAFLEGSKIRHAFLPPRVSRLLTRLTPNAGRQARLKAGAQRTLAAVVCTLWFSAASV